MARGEVRSQPDDLMLDALEAQRKGFTSLGWSWKEASGTASLEGQVGGGRVCKEEESSE